MAHPDSVKLRKLYGTLFDDVRAALFRTDPMGLNFEENTDEYDPEARTILPRLRHCASVDEARAAIHEEFQRWFGADTAGPIGHYSKAAEEVWAIWQRRSADSRPPAAALTRRPLRKRPSPRRTAPAAGSLRRRRGRGEDGEGETGITQITQI
jgi:hypothetical protein